MIMKRYTLYIDESGIRYPQHKSPPRKDGMDSFGWGGILVEKDKEGEIVASYKKFCKKWDIIYPLHSNEIRGKRDNFKWLAAYSRQGEFFCDLNLFLTKIDVVGFGVVVSRPGYNKRYTEKYGNSRWELCKTTHPILVERVVKHLIKLGEEFKLKIIFEGSSGSDNRKIIKYGQSLKSEGHPFSKPSTEKYSPLSSSIYQDVISGRHGPGTKDNIFLQIADLYVYPMVKFRYDPSYLPWHELYKSNRLIDSILESDQLFLNGIKYYCFVTE